MSNRAMVPSTDVNMTVGDDTVLVDIGSKTICLTNETSVPPAGLFTQPICEHLPLGSDLCLLDVGCGSGVVGIFALLNGAHYVLFNDLQKEAVDAVHRNLWLNGIEARHHTCHWGSFAELSLAEHEFVNLIAFNPPHLPSAVFTAVHLSPSERLFRDGGPDGLCVVREFLDWYAEQPPPTPTCIIALSSIVGENRILEEIAFKRNLVLRVLQRESVPLRRDLVKGLTRLSNDDLTYRGLFCQDSVWYQRLSVVRIRKPTSF